MVRNRFACIHHFRNVVTNSVGDPTCRECGRSPTEAELESVQTLIDWEEARLRRTLLPRRKR